MVEIPQPAESQYDVGSTVQIHLGEDDMDAEHHGKVCEVTAITTDELSTVTGRELDKYWYNLQVVETGEELDLRFRHFDLVPVEDKNP